MIKYQETQDHLLLGLEEDVDVDEDWVVEGFVAGVDVDAGGVDGVAVDAGGGVVVVDDGEPRDDLLGGGGGGGTRVEAGSRALEINLR